MENLLSSVFLLPLQKIALRKVVALLWTSGEDYIMQLSRNDNHFQETVERKIADKISELILPKPLKKQLLLLVNPIGLQIQRWAGFHKGYLSPKLKEFGMPTLEKLRWTSAGIVDYSKTAKELICCEMIDSVKRYKLACLYCLDDYISGIWEELPEDIKRELYYKEDTSLTQKPFIQFYWPYILKGEQSKLDNMVIQRLSENDPITFHQYAFEHSTLLSNKAATKYFFQKLSQEERESSLMTSVLNILSVRNLRYYLRSDFFPKEESTNVLCYLLFQMNHEQQMQIFKEKPSEVLCYFLDWPWQDVFFEIADLVSAFLPKRDYTELLFSMHTRSKGSNSNFSKLFREFFTRSPIDFKKQFVDVETAVGGSSFIQNFYDVQDLETIEVIFRNLDVVDRMRLVSSKRICQLFHANILQDKGQMVEVCLRVATLSKEDRKRLEVAFESFMPRTARDELRRRESCETFLRQEIFRCEEIYREWENSPSLEEMRRNISREVETNEKVLKEFLQILYLTNKSTQSKRSLEKETLTDAKRTNVEN